MRGGVTPANTKLLNDALTDFPDAKIQTEAQFEKNQEQGIDVLLNLLFVLLGLSIVDLALRDREHARADGVRAHA